MTFFKENIRFLRKKNNLTQADMLASAGFKRNAWNNYETGASTPNFSDIIKISEYFQVTVGQLFDALIEDDGKVPDFTTDSKNDKNSKMNGKVLGKVQPQNNYLNEPEAPYKNAQILLQEKEEIILALKGQIEALKQALTHAEQRINEMGNNKNNGK